MTSTQPQQEPPVALRAVPAARMFDIKEKKLLILAQVRSVGVDARNIQRQIDIVENKANTISPTVRADEMKAALDSAQSVFKEDGEQQGARVDDLKKLVRESGDLATCFEDDIARLENLWQRVKKSWPAPDVGADAAVVRMREVTSLLNELNLLVGKITIPERANRRLQELPVGRALNFHAQFAEELPREEDRTLVLEMLASHPGMVQGLVDVRQGVIYRASPKRARRCASYLLISAVIAVGGLLAYVLGHGFAPLSIPVLVHGHSGRELAGIYLVLFVGALTHLGVQGLKQVRGALLGKEPSVLALADWLLWAHVKELSILAGGVLAVWLAFLGLVLGLEKFDIPTAFFVGYSADSFVDVFLSRFDSIATSRVAALKKTGA